MENNEIMNYEEIEVMDDEIVADGGTSIGTGVAMLIGAGLAAAVGAAVVAGKKVIAHVKEKRKLKKPDKEVLVDESNIQKVVAK